MFVKLCRLCPRGCGVDRVRGERGYCGAGAEPVVYRHGPHHGEEPPISGLRGSGTVFFSHCTLKCCYCQNYPWSQEHQGQALNVAGLRGLLQKLAQDGAHNWNLVSPTPWWPWIDAALSELKNGGVRLPIVYNTSGFESVETLEQYADWIDVALTDLRYARPETAQTASDCAAYVERARRALQWFWTRLGPLECQSDGTARRGTICRILVLPGHAEEAMENLQWLRDTIGTEISISLMAQYTPLYRATEPPWNRRITAREYDRVVDTMEKMGFEQGWVQDCDDAAPDALLGCRMNPDPERNDDHERTQ